MLVLASASPRRIELLRSVGIDPLVDPADVPEIPDPARSPEENAAAFAREKATTVAARHPDAAVLAADTIVVADGLLLGKPEGPADARAMLDRLAGRGHRVVTCVTLLPAHHTTNGGGWPATHLRVSTAVWFRDLTEAERDAYVASGEWEGKAGGYAIQGRAGCFVRALRGSYSNVVGLPLSEVVVELRAAGVLAADWGPR